MATSRFWKRTIPLAILGVMAGAGLVLYRSFSRQHSELPTTSAEPSCRIRFLTREERLNPERMWRHPVDAHEAERPYPPGEVDNPILFKMRFARVLFENTTDRILSVYGPGKPSPDDTGGDRAEREFLNEKQGMSERVKEYLLSCLEPVSGLHPAYCCLRVDVEVFGSDGKLIEPKPEIWECIQFSGIEFPSPAEYQAGGYLAHELQPGEVIELRMPSLFGQLRPSQITPGTYTVRAVVVYAEAPSGETKRVTSEPVAVTITAGHLKSAEAHWGRVR